MFVWPHKLILKTCGTTTLLLGLPTLLRIASERCGLGGVWRCFYSRKTFMFPDRQRGPHKDWAQEMSFLDNLFGQLPYDFATFVRPADSAVPRLAEDSSAYTVGRMNGDHWLLYLTPPADNVLLPNALASASAVQPANPSTPLASLSASLAAAPKLRSTPSSVSVPRNPSLPTPSRPDQTLEILMTGLSPAACASFYHPSSPFPFSLEGKPPKESYTSPLYPSDARDADAHALGTQLADRLGLTNLLPEATTDSFLFSPCGYSSNSVLGDRYATIHVTPEPEYSYASFETNVDFAGVSDSHDASHRNLQQLVEKVLKIFQPAKLSVTLFVEIPEDGSEQLKGEAHSRMRELLHPELVDRYERVDRIVYEFEGYSLVYAVFTEKK